MEFLVGVVAIIVIVVATGCTSFAVTVFTESRIIGGVTGFVTGMAIMSLIGESAW
jgi:hypothetical protein